jgi:hypothetical protein
MIKIDLIDESDYDKPLNRNFMWKITSYSEKDMYIQLFFDEPLKVSTGDQYDRIRIIFNDTRFIFDENGEEILNGTLVMRDIPPLFADQKEADIFVGFN